MMKIDIDKAVNLVRSIRESEAERAKLPYSVDGDGVELKVIDFFDTFFDFTVDYDYDNPFYIYSFRVSCSDTDFRSHATREDIEELSELYDVRELLELEKEFDSYSGKIIHSNRREYE